MAIEPFSTDPGLNFNMGTNQGEGLMQLAEFKTNKYTDMIGELLPSMYEKGLIMETDIHGEKVPYNILGKYKKQLQENEATNEWGSGYEGDVSDTIKEFMDNNPPENPQEWEDMKNMLDQLPNNVKKNLKEKMPGVYYPPKNQSFNWLMSQARNIQPKNLGITNPWLNMPGVQVASMGNLAGMGIPNVLQQQRQQAELMHAGNIALNQTPAQVQAQVAASQATQQDNYQAPTMSQQQMVQEAQQTGGTVNPHEATQAAWTPPAQSDLDAVMAKGGLVSVNHLTRRL